MKARIAEIFESIQGEGIYLGEKQIFLRFFGCNLDCEFCDTRLTEFKEYTPEGLVREIAKYPDGYHSLAITGGEPLMQKDFLKQFLALIKKMHRKIYLETNGTLPQALSELIDYLDIIAMDIKLPSSTGERGYWQAQGDFLKEALRKEVFVKAVICASTTQEDLEKACLLVQQADKNIPFILQPNSLELGEALNQKLRYFKSSASRMLNDVRIIAQMHKMLGVR